MADRAQVMARLLEGAAHAELVGSLVAGVDVALDAPLHGPPALVVIDGAALPPGADGVTLRRLRQRMCAVPIVVLADVSTTDWYALGATVVLPGDASAVVIGAQLRVLADRAPVADLEVELLVGPFRYRHGRRSIDFAGTLVRCGPGPIQLLLRLLRAGGDVVSSAALCRAAGGSSGGEAVALGAQLHRLRRCLEAVAPGLGACVVSVRGEGYRLDVEQAYRAQQVTSDARPRDRT